MKSVIFDQEGNVIIQSDNIENHPESVHVTLVDIDWKKYQIEKFDMETKNPILKEIPLTPEQQRIQELENELLLMADAETGGIL